MLTVVQEVPTKAPLKANALLLN